MKLFVKTLKGDQKELSIAPEAPVSELARTVGELNGVPAEKVKLIHKAKTLEHTKTLGDYGVADGDSVVVVLLKVG